MHLLIVEDVADLIQLLEAVFAQDDVEIRGFSNPVDLTDDDYRWADMALIDWMMPHANGGQIVKDAHAANPDLHITIWTAIPDFVETDIPCEVLRKNSDIAELREVVLRDR